jgi:dihydroxyacetone kinase-like protein
MTTLNGATARQWIDAFEADFARNAHELGELDRKAGDGDFADNITSALSKARRFIDDENPTTYRATFTALARGFLDTGGTSGPLFGMLFRAVAKAATTEDDGVELSDLAQAVAQGLHAIQERGGAQVGDNTLVDALAPASAALTRATPNDSLGTALQQAAEAAEHGAATTEDMIARRGRASYVGEHARGVKDPGAMAIGIFFRAGARVT